MNLIKKIVVCAGIACIIPTYSSQEVVNLATAYFPNYKTREALEIGKQKLVAEITALLDTKELKPAEFQKYLKTLQEVYSYVYAQFAFKKSSHAKAFLAPSFITHPSLPL